MKNWLRRKLYNFINNNNECSTLASGAESYQKNSYGTAVSRGQGNGELLFTVSSARGGLIVSVRTYDKPRDDYQYINHLIHDDQDANKNIADIVSIELMKL